MTLSHETNTKHRRRVLHLDGGCGHAWNYRTGAPNLTANPAAVTCRKCLVTRAYRDACIRAGLPARPTTWPAHGRRGQP